MLAGFFDGDGFFTVNKHYEVAAIGQACEREQPRELLAIEQHIAKAVFGLQAGSASVQRNAIMRSRPATCVNWGWDMTVDADGLVLLGRPQGARSYYVLRYSGADARRVRCYLQEGEPTACEKIVGAFFISLIERTTE
jgi:hypothetical protein